jgi:hypothetical protein
MQFFIEQIALCPQNPRLAKQLLSEMGAVEWHEDRVVAGGEVYGKPSANVANLSFNYQLSASEPRALEVEVLHYVKGQNWMQEASRHNSISHLGMHCTDEQLVQWRAFFAERQIRVAQEVFTQDHTNPVIAGKRWYNYVIFNTKAILGVDVKFIVRHDQPPVTTP